MSITLELWMLIPALLFIAPLVELIHSQDADSALGALIVCWPLMIAYLMGHYQERPNVCQLVARAA